MKKERTLYQLYAGHDRGSALSVAGGAFRLLSLLLIAAALYTLALLLSGFRVTLAGGLGTAFLFLMDELDDELLAAFFLWGLVIACRYTASCSRRRPGCWSSRSRRPSRPRRLRQRRRRRWSRPFCKPIL